MAPQGSCLAVDFGTSNTAAGILRDDTVELIRLSGEAFTLPTTFFFDADSRRTLIGDEANRALLDGEEGRFMRALKRVLGTPLMHEQRQILTERLTFVDLIGRFLGEVKARAERQTGLTFERVLSGRPVVFHGPDDPREGQAEDDLRACYAAAGFTEVSFLMEPEAAALASGAQDRLGDLAMIVDIGGGTSDFSLFRAGPDGIEILANHGIRIGGTDFDRAISIDHVMPAFGKGTDLRRAFGPGLTPVPTAIFNDLATWEKIPFVQTPQAARKVAEMLRVSTAPDRLGRLATVLENALGHDVAFAVEAGKIAANGASRSGRIDLSEVEPGLALRLDAAGLDDSLAPSVDALREAARRTCALAGVAAQQVDRVVYVGGSSLMNIVGRALMAELPGAAQSRANVFTGVVEGLARATTRRGASG